MWEKYEKELDTMTVRELLDALAGTTEHCLLRAILDGREYVIKRACAVYLRQVLEGGMSEEIRQERDLIYQQLKGEQ